MQLENSTMVEIKANLSHVFFFILYNFSNFCTVSLRFTDRLLFLKLSVEGISSKAPCSHAAHGMAWKTVQQVTDGVLSTTPWMTGALEAPTKYFVMGLGCMLSRKEFLGSFILKITQRMSMS